ncbi:hypothetical protein NMG60_11013851 [Bertholletia excelsa]
MPSMASSSVFHRILIISSLVFAAVIVSATAGGDHHRWGLAPKTDGCQGSLADCMAGGDGEFDMDSEINRRVLATTKYISYGALQSNTVPCSQRGASYYNCQPGAQANPYSRGCSTITRCRS